MHAWYDFCELLACDSHRATEEPCAALGYGFDRSGVLKGNPVKVVVSAQIRWLWVTMRVAACLGWRRDSSRRDSRAVHEADRGERAATESSSRRRRVLLVSSDQARRERSSNFKRLILIDDASLASVVRRNAARRGGGRRRGRGGRKPALRRRARGAVECEAECALSRLRVQQRAAGAERRKCSFDRDSRSVIHFSVRSTPTARKHLADRRPAGRRRAFDAGQYSETAARAARDAAPPLGERLEERERSAHAVKPGTTTLQPRTPSFRRAARAEAGRRTRRAHRGARCS